MRERDRQRRRDRQMESVDDPAVCENKGVVRESQKKKHEESHSGGEMLSSLVQGNNSSQ